MALNIAPTRTRFISDLYCCWKVIRATLRVHILTLLRYSKASIKLFHMDWNFRINNVRRAGLERGITTFLKISIKLAPSIVQDSSSSAGIDLKYWVRRKIPKASTEPGRIRAQ